MLTTTKLQRQHDAIKATQLQLAALEKANASARLIAQLRTKLTRQTAALALTEELAKLEAKAGK